MRIEEKGRDNNGKEMKRGDKRVGKEIKGRKKREKECKREKRETEERRGTRR